ncbi:uncharacterized protein LOC101236801 isoform X3 [Hydra vulgaris]|uniref:Uncharacterized protein LOC101236801 isoform X3 n=1 Tax=Hydra vulgaris TaxID=6087 RepID=A0ABM4BDQ0_HYDVU
MSRIVFITLLWLSKGKSERDGIGVVRELWSHVHGTSLQNLIADSRFPHQPTNVTPLQDFDAPIDSTSEDIGQRIKGYFLAPTNGGYRFYSSCSGSCEVFLGFNDMEGESNRIIKQHRSSHHNEFFSFPDQKSRIVALEKGKRYYLEAIGKNSKDVHHLSVGVELPDGQKVFPITSNLLRRNKDPNQDDTNKQRQDFDTIVELGNAKIIVPHKSNKKISLEAQPEENEPGLVRGIKEDALTLEIGFENNETMENDVQSQTKLFSKEKLKKPDVKVEEVSFDTDNLQKTNKNISKAIDESKENLEKPFLYKIPTNKNNNEFTVILPNEIPALSKKSKENEPQKLKNIIKTNTSIKNFGVIRSPKNDNEIRKIENDDVLGTLQNKLISFGHKLSSIKKKKTQNLKNIRNVSKLNFNNDDDSQLMAVKHSDLVIKASMSSKESRLVDQKNLLKKDPMEFSLLTKHREFFPSDVKAKIKNKGTIDYTPIKRETSNLNSKKKPDIIKVEFIPDEETIEIVNGSKIENPKKAGTVRVQFIPGEFVEKKNSNNSIKKQASEKSEKENDGDGLTNNADENDDETMHNEIVEIKSENKNLKKQEEMKTQMMQQNDENGQTRHKKKHKSVNGYEANPILPEKISLATLSGEKDKKAPLTIQSPLTTEGSSAPNKVVNEDKNRGPIPIDGIENLTEEHIDPPLTALGEKFKDLIPPEQKMMLGNNLGNIEKANNPPLPRAGLASDPDRVFVGGDVVQSPQGQVSHQDDPDPNPTHNAPSDPVGGQGPVVNPVAGHLLSALNQNAVTPEEALQMMNDFISGNQDMQKAASIMDGMLGKISAQRKQSNKLLGRENHFMEDMNKVNTEIEPGFADPSLMKMFPEKFSGTHSNVGMLNDPFNNDHRISANRKPIGVEPMSFGVEANPLRDRNVADNLDEIAGNRLGSYMNLAGDSPSYIANNRNGMSSSGPNFNDGHSKNYLNEPNSFLGQNNNAMEKSFDYGYNNPLFEKPQGIESNEINNFDQNSYNEFHKDQNLLKSYEESPTYRSQGNTEIRYNSDLTDNLFHKNGLETFSNIESTRRKSATTGFDRTEQDNFPNLMGDLASGNIHVDIPNGNGMREPVHNDLQQDGVNEEWKSRESLHQEEYQKPNDQNFARKYLTPSPIQVKSDENNNLQGMPKGGLEKNKHALADMYTDSIFPEDFEDIQSLKGDLQGQTLTSYDRPQQQKQIKTKKGSFIRSELKASYPLEASALGGMWGAGEARSTVPKSKIPTKRQSVAKKNSNYKKKLSNKTKSNKKFLHRERREEWSLNKNILLNTSLIPRKHLLYNGFNENTFKNVVQDSNVLKSEYPVNYWKSLKSNTSTSAALKSEVVKDSILQIGQNKLKMFNQKADKNTIIDSNKLNSKINNGYKYLQNSNIKSVFRKVERTKNNSLNQKGELNFFYNQRKGAEGIKKGVENIQKTANANNHKLTIKETSFEKTNLTHNNINISTNSLTSTDISSDTSLYPDKTDWADILVDNADDLKGVDKVAEKAAERQSNIVKVNYTKTILNPMQVKPILKKVALKTSQIFNLTKVENQVVNQTLIKNIKSLNGTKSSKQLKPLKNAFAIKYEGKPSSAKLLQTNYSNHENAPINSDTNDNLLTNPYKPSMQVEEFDPNQSTEVSDKGLRELMRELKDVLYRLRQYKLKAKRLHQSHHRNRNRNYYINNVYQEKTPFIGETLNNQGLLRLPERKPFTGEAALSNQALSRLQGIDRGEIESAIASLNEPVQHPVVKDMDIENYLQEVYDPGMRGFEGPLGRIESSPTLKDEPISNAGVYPDMEELSSFDNSYENNSGSYSKRETLPRVKIGKKGKQIP